MVILAILILVLAMGLFLLLQERDFSNIDLFIIVVFCNALSAMPLLQVYLSAPFHTTIWRYYENLCNSPES